jgi:hypothetical protein
MHPESAANDSVARPMPLRVETTAEIRGRPCAVLAWFSRADHEVGILRPVLVTALAVDPDGEVHEGLTRAELEPLMARLVARAEQLQEG